MDSPQSEALGRGPGRDALGSPGISVRPRGRRRTRRRGHIRSRGEGNCATSETSPTSEESQCDELSATRETNNNDSSANEGQHHIVSLNKLKSLIYSEDFRRIKESIVRKDIIIFMGISKCGKSSLINAAIGNKLCGVPTALKRFKISKKGDTPGPEIGDSSVSRSTVPTAWYSRELACVILDTPGFDDNRGVAQDIANAFQLKEVITRAASAKIVLIADIGDVLSDNIDSFLKLLDLVNTMFPNTESMFGGMTLVLTKDRDALKVGDIQTIFSQKMVNEDKIYINNKSLVAYFMRNISAVSIVRMPKTEEVLDRSFFGDMFRSIKAAESIQGEVLVGASPGISNRSKAFLLEKYCQLVEGDVLKKFLQQIEQKFDEVVNEYSPSQEMSLKELEDIKGKFKFFYSRVESSIGKKESVNDKLKNVCILVFGSNNKHIINTLGDVTDQLDFTAFIDGILSTSNCKQFELDLSIFTDYMNNSCEKHNIRYVKAFHQINERKSQEKCTRLEREMRELQEKMAIKKTDEKMYNGLQKELRQIQATLQRNEELRLEEAQKNSLLERKITVLERQIQENEVKTKRLIEELKSKDEENLKRQREQAGVFAKAGKYIDGAVSMFLKL